MEVHHAAPLELRDLDERQSGQFAEVGYQDAGRRARTRRRVIVKRRHSSGACQLNATCRDSRSSRRTAADRAGDRRRCGRGCTRSAGRVGTAAAFHAADGTGRCCRRVPSGSVDRTEARSGQRGEHQRMRPDRLRHALAAASGAGVQQLPHIAGILREHDGHTDARRFPHRTSSTRSGSRSVSTPPAADHPSRARPPGHAAAPAASSARTGQPDRPTDRSPAARPDGRSSRPSRVGRWSPRRPGDAPADRTAAAWARPGGNDWTGWATAPRAGRAGGRYAVGRLGPVEGQPQLAVHTRQPAASAWSCLRASGVGSSLCRHVTARRCRQSGDLGVGEEGGLHPARYAALGEQPARRRVWSGLIAAAV